MAEIALPRNQSLVGPAFQSKKYDYPGQPFVDSSQFSDALSHNPFVLPPRTSSEAEDHSISPTKPNNTTAGLNDGRTAQRGHQRTRNSVHALPSFNFNASDSTGHGSGTATPPSEADVDAPVTPTRASRHRRIASEHISASATGTVRLRSRSPLKNDVQMPSVDAVRPPGHRHRRSGAVSQDFSDFVLPSPPPSPTISQPYRADSLTKLPSSSLEPKLAFKSPFAAMEPEESFPKSHGAADGCPPPRPASQARVGFSDTLEFIPRPLSTISSETESSLSTLRGHSVAGSISSVLSGGPTSPATRMSPAALRSKVETQTTPPRPKSAGIIMDRSRRGLLNMTHELAHLGRPISASGPPSPATARMLDLDPRNALVQDRSSSPSRKELLRARNVRSWATSLVHRRAKSPGEQDASTKSPSPSDILETHPSTEPTWSASPVALSENFDEDPTSTILHDIPAYVHSPQITNVDRAVNVSTPSEAVGPVIDLDLAHAPFDTSSTASHGYLSKTRRFSAARHVMHSSGSLGGFMGPGMHYHRRSESAPQLAAMELDRPILPRLHSSSSSEVVHEMEDVFEEDEDASETPKTKNAPSEMLKSAEGGAGDSAITSTATDKVEAPSPTRRPRSYQRPLSNRMNRPSRLVNSRPTRSCEPQNLTTHPGQEAVVVFDEHSPAPSESFFGGSSNSAVTSPTVDEPKQSPITSDMPITFIPNRSNPSTPTDSMFLSPQSPFNLPYSFSTPTLESSAISFTESRKHSMYGPGESASEFRPSVDDVPSLISSRSGVTSANHTHIPSVSSRNYADCDASFKSSTSALPLSDQRWKRASIASLSRLVGGSFGEKSKLSTEQSASRLSVLPAKSKDKRSRRLGRLLQFWKSKESQSVR